MVETHSQSFFTFVQSDQKAVNLTREENRKRGKEKKELALTKINERKKKKKQNLM